jgi:hypothetical protein
MGDIALVQQSAEEYRQRVQQVKSLLDNRLIKLHTLQFIRGQAYSAK